MQVEIIMIDKFRRFSKIWLEVKIYIQKWILSHLQVKIIMIDDSADFWIFGRKQDLGSKIDSEPRISQNHYD